MVRLLYCCVNAQAVKSKKEACGCKLRDFFFYFFIRRKKYIFMHAYLNLFDKDGQFFYWIPRRMNLDGILLNQRPSYCCSLRKAYQFGRDHLHFCFSGIFPLFSYDTKFTL